MARHIRKRRGSPAGAAPGSLISHPGAEAPTLHLFSYGPDAIEEIEDAAIAEDITGRLSAWLQRRRG